jgi:CheY-like chemotaxis protein
MDSMPHASGAQILLVDDEPDQVEMYRYALEDGGFTVTSANSGADGVTRARELQPDLIVLDVRLPDMTGWDVCAVLKTDPRTEHIPVLILTAAATPSLAQEATAAGCSGYLLKPCYPTELTASVRAILAAT